MARCQGHSNVTDNAGARCRVAGRVRGRNRDRRVDLATQLANYARALISGPIANRKVPVATASGYLAVSVSGQVLLVVLHGLTIQGVLHILNVGCAVVHVVLLMILVMLDVKVTTRVVVSQMDMSLCL